MYPLEDWMHCVRCTESRWIGLICLGENMGCCVFDIEGAVGNLRESQVGLMRSAGVKRVHCTVSNRTKRVNTPSWHIKRDVQMWGTFLKFKEPPHNVQVVYRSSAFIFIIIFLSHGQQKTCIFTDKKGNTSLEPYCITLQKRIVQNSTVKCNSQYKFWKNG